MRDNQYFGGKEVPSAKTEEDCKAACLALGSGCAAVDWNKTRKACYTLDTLEGKWNRANTDVDTLIREECASK